jgi:tetratricopeptide (TPR) repeat protein
VQAPSSVTPTAKPTATATAPPATLQPTPTLTLSPAVRVENANRALRDGDYEAAIEHFQIALQLADEELSQRLVLPLARAYFAAGQYEELATLPDRWDFAALAVSDRAIALGLLARSYEALEQWEKAISAYERYLELDDAATHQVRLQISRAYQILGQTDEAAEQLQQIELAELDASTQATILEELAGLLTELGASERALATYDQILSFARTAWYRSVILLHKGQLLLDMGREEEGVAVLHEAVGQYPQTWGAYAAMQTLDQIDAAEISLLQRGEILYHLEQHEQSIEALERYRLARPFGFHSTARLYSGLAYHALGRYEDAVEQFDKVIREFAWTAVAGDAWMAKARTLAALGEEPSTLYQEFVKRYPDHPRAPEALWRAAVGLERRGDWEQAGGFYGALCDEYGDDSRAEEACFRHGLAAYAVGDHHHALELWERTLAALPPDAGPAGDSSSRARALTWMGLASAAAGEEESAEALWRDAAGLAPESYYALRARDLIAADPLRLSLYPAVHVPPFELSSDNWRQIEEWVHGWAPGEDDPHGPIEEQTLVRRGDAL